MDLNDTARVRHPRCPVEHRLGTVIDLIPAPYSTYIERYRLQFPTGDERTYTADAVVACTRDDDRTALIAAVTDAGQRLRDACRIAHDYDDDLSAEIVALSMLLLTTAGARLGVTLDPEADTAATAPARARAEDRSQEVQR